VYVLVRVRARVFLRGCMLGADGLVCYNVVCGPEWFSCSIMECFRCMVSSATIHPRVGACTNQQIHKITTCNKNTTHARYSPTRPTRVHTTHSCSYCLEYEFVTALNNVEVCCTCTRVHTGLHTNNRKNQRHAQIPA